MSKIGEFRRRLAALDVEQIAAGSASPATSLVSCRALESGLRSLKRQVLAELTTLRAGAEERGTRSRKPLTPEGARQLLKDVQDRVTGFLDNREARDALGQWSQIDREIDDRLARLAELEAKLARTVGAPDAAVRRQTAGEDPDDEVYAAAAPRPADRSNEEGRESGDDDFYAAVGAAAQKGSRHDAYCSHCGQGVEPEDRFCRKCGRRLG